MAVLDDAAMLRRSVVSDLRFVANISGDQTARLVLDAISRVGDDATGIEVIAEVLEAVEKAVVQ